MLQVTWVRDCIIYFNPCIVFVSFFVCQFLVNFCQCFKVMFKILSKLVWQGGLSIIPTVIGLGSFHVTQRRSTNPVSPNWLILGTSVAWHVYEAYQAVSANSEWFWRYALSILAFSVPSSTHSNMFYVNNYSPWIAVDMKIDMSIVFEVENQKMKIKTLKKIRFQLKYGSYQRKK